MALESTVLARAGTLIIAPPATEGNRQPHVQKNLREDEQPRRPAESEIILRRGNAQTFADADKFRQQKNAASENEFGGGFQSNTAINAYQSLAFETRKEELKELIGVDTYA